MIQQVYQLALDALRHHLAASELAYREEDGDLLLDDHRLGLSVTFEGFSRQAGQCIAPLDIQIHVDGDEGDQFRVGTLGVGATEDEALHAAVDEWHVLAAAPVLSALGAKAGSRRRESGYPKLAGWDLYPGRAGIRGALPDGLQASGPLFRELLQALRTSVSSWEVPSRQTLRSIFVMANANEGQLEVQAALDGFVDEALTASLRELAWPCGAQAYFYKQLFVLCGGA